MSVTAYLLSLPERFVRSTLGLGAGVVREAGELTLPRSVRRGRLYQNLVDTTLRYVIERVGGVEGVYQIDGNLPDDFLVRRTAGNAVEVLGIITLHASPVWVLAALADVCGIGRHLIPEISGALKAQGLLEPDAEFTSVDQIVDGLERTSSRLAETFNTPPLDVAALQDEWRAVRLEARRLPAASLPSRTAIRDMWCQLKEESVRQDRSVFETSSMIAVSTVRAVPDRMRWLSRSARVSAAHTGQIFAAVLLEHYRQSLAEMRRTGFVAYARRQFRPYIRAALGQFSPNRRTLTQRLLDRLSKRP